MVANNTSLGITNSITNSAISSIELGQDVRYPQDINRNSNNAFDDFRVWNVARMPAEIAANYRSCLVGNEPGLDWFSTP